MIKSVLYRNFQSHKKTLLEFHDGINIIMGPTDSGKTSLLRGLYWVRYNRPRGDDFISNWNRTDKGKPIKATVVTVTMTDGQIKRIKSPQLNGYKIFIQEPNSPHWNEYKEYLNNRYLHKNKIQEFADLLFKKNVHGVPKETILKMIDKWALNPSLNDYLNYGKNSDND